MWWRGARFRNNMLFNKRYRVRTQYILGVQKEGYSCSKKTYTDSYHVFKFMAEAKKKALIKHRRLIGVDIFWNKIYCWVEKL
jgi:hypothetical protein